jgi:transposase-like protein
VVPQNGLNGDLLHRWVREYIDGKRNAHAGTSVAVQFLPVLTLSKSERLAAGVKRIWIMANLNTPGVLLVLAARVKRRRVLDQPRLHK